MEKFDKSHMLPDPCDRKNYKGYHETPHGYILVMKLSHPYSPKSGYIPEHRLVMEYVLQRYLTKEELVHHIDRDKKNNSPENLQIVSMSEHRTIHNNEDKSYESKYNLEEIKELYLEGFSTREIAKQVGIGKSTVGYYIKKWGIARTELSSAVHINNPLNQRQITDEEIETINKMYEEGHYVSDISKETGWSRNTVYDYLKNINRLNKTKEAI